MENSDIKKQKEERFRSMGIPIPMDKSHLEQPIVNVKDPKMLARIQEIKNGAKKGEFNELLSTGNEKGFKPLPEPKRKNNRQPSSETKAPALESFAPKSAGGDLDIYEKLFSGEGTSTSSPKTSSGQRLQEEVNTDLNGTDFLNNFRQKLQAKAASNGIPASNSGFGIKTQYEQPKIDLNEIESKIYQISSEVAKKIAQETIKEVLDKYLSKKTNLNENTFTKVKDDIIKIGDKYYKLTPVKLKDK